MSTARAFAGALFSFSIVMAVPAIAASRAEPVDRHEAHSDMLDREAAEAERFSSDWLDTVAPKMATAPEGHLPVSADTISGLMMPTLYGGEVVLPSQPPRSNSSVPLPTGFSLFGAGLLTLGLIGVMSGGQRRLVLEAGCLADLDVGRVPAAAPPSVRYKIEVRSERGCQLHNTVSARGAIDLIADLLNEGWDIVSIRDRDGLPADYEDLLAAWHSERVDDRKRHAALS